MKSYTLICFFLSLAMILFPLISVEKATDAISREFFNEEMAEKDETAKRETVNDDGGTDSDSTVKVMNANSKNITSLSLEDYLIGVAAAEINPAYHEEAVKAQIVAAHTKLEYTKLHKTDSLEDADITDSAATHQGYLTEDEQKKKWGDNYKVYREKIEKCVKEVLNVVMLYENEPINAVFHAVSNGQTANASDVWGGNYPYLVSVQSAGDKLSPAYKSEVTVKKEEFKEKLVEKGANFSDNPEKWVEKITNTETGMVKEITIGEKTFKGSEIRSIFGLKSSTFAVSYSDGNFVFTVCGYGHGVGMSQYGADYLARQGFGYKDILNHYYKNITIQ